ncbi:MAG TPA: NAD(P)-dependent oxidoreductase [Actinocrinis sp.]|nr:NAD(P)-dependent oxidoreductase [Actinocrinis sp.]
MIVVPQPSVHEPVRRAWADHPFAGRVRRFDRPAGGDGELIERMRGAQTVLHFFDDGPLPAAALRETRPRRVVIAGPAGSLVDAAGLEAVGGALYDTPGLAADAVAEFTLALILAGARGIGGPGAAWAPRFGTDLRDLRLGLVGLGRIGSRVARLATALGIRVAAWSPTPDPRRMAEAGATAMELDDLLIGSDVVSLHLRAGQGAGPVIDARRIGLLGRRAVLVNTARAALVDTDALREALAAGRIAGAALDVHDQEPLPPQDPLWRLPGVLVTAHTAWMTHGTVARFLDAALRFACVGDDSLVRRVAA